MIPNSFQRGSRGGRSNLPLPLVIAGAVGVIVLAICAWVALTMGTVPQPSR